MTDMTTIIIAASGFSAIVGVVARMSIMETRIMEAIKANTEKHYHITYAKGQAPEPSPYRHPLEVASRGGALMCGGCGKSVPTMDGFNPIAHDCYDPDEENADQMDLPIAFPTGCDKVSPQSN